MSRMEPQDDPLMQVELEQLKNYRRMTTGTVTTASTGLLNGSSTTLINGSGSTLTVNPYNIPNLDYSQLLQTLGSVGVSGHSGVAGYRVPDKEPQTLEEKLNELIFMTEDDPEVCKFVKAAKAVMDKRMLDTINQHIDGDSKPNRETGQDG